MCVKFGNKALLLTHVGSLMLGVSLFSYMCYFTLTPLFLFNSFSNIEHGHWESQIDAWQRPILEDKRLPEW